MIDSNLQKEIYDWKVKNFGGIVKYGHQSLLGVIEEIGELSHAVLKKQQGIRCANSFESCNNEMKDAVGDIYIFLMNYLSEKKIEFKPVLIFIDHSTIIGDDEKIIWSLVSKANELIEMQISFEDCFLSKFFKSELLSSAKLLVNDLHFFCACHNWDFDDVINNIWDNVKKRNWVDNKINGENNA